MDKNQRLASLDALRGFDMFFITGGAGLICGLCQALGFEGSWLFRQMNHVPWEGFQHHDTIFPLFLFLAGVSFPFSLASQRAKGYSDLKIYLRILKRAAILFAIGLSFGNILWFDPHFRLCSVLGFIGLSWGFAAAFFTAVEDQKKRWLAFAAIVLGYFALLHFGINPGAPAGADSYCKEWNIIRWFDLHVYPEHLLIPVSKAGEAIPYEPESLFSLPGGIAIAMMGMFAGSVLRSAVAAQRKALTLLLAGCATFVIYLGFRFLVGVPIVKALWTVSFVFAAATYAFWMLSLFYYIVDVRGWKKWTIAFDPVGKNSILIYTLSMMGIIGSVRAFLFGGLGNVVGIWKWSLEGLTCYLVGWCLLRFCQKHDIFLKV